MTERNQGQKTVGGPTVVPTQAEPQLDLPPALVADEALIVRPGDVLLLRLDRVLSDYDIDIVKQRVGNLLPELGGIVVLSGVQGIAVYRPGGG